MRPGPAGRTHALTRFALLVAVAVILHVFEGLFPPPLPVPGARVGLANIVSLICLVSLGPRSAIQLVVLRTVLASLVGGGLLGFGFLLSFVAGLGSVLAMILLRRAGRDLFSLIGLSLFGALVHNLTQLVMAAVIVGHWGLMAYLPYMLLGSLPAGALTGVAAHAALTARNHALDRWLGQGPAPERLEGRPAS